MSASTALPTSTPPSPANIQLMQFTTACWASRCLHVWPSWRADALGDQPQSTEALAKATSTSRKLCTACCACWPRLGSSNGEMEPGITPSHRASFAPIIPESLRDYVRMLGLPVFWSALEDLEHSLRTVRMCVYQASP